MFGAFEDANQGVHQQVQILAVSRLKAVGLQQGRDTAKAEIGFLVGTWEGC